MAELKPQFAASYKVDAELVADAILRKLSLVKLARRRGFGSAADRKPEPPAPRL